MAGVPVNFQAFSNVLANYDFVDIASGTGYINFYVGDSVDLKLLSNFTFYAHSMYDSSTTFINGADTKRLDIDFDTVLNRPMDIRGKSIVNIPVRWTSSGNSSFVYITVRVRKWDGTTETEIANNDSTHYTLGGIDSYYMLSIDLDIPLTHFKVGETLRLTIEGWGYTTGAGITCDLKVAHDPMGRVTDWDATGTVPSKFMFQCPVRLNL